ncbi:MAG: hypothetical protein GX604_05520 [Actinobacteria bacterium]|nr:hypothetical protein [Actinomycetota bacterium]
MSTECTPSIEHGSESSDRISLSFPARAEFVAICRLALTGLGSGAGLDQEKVADLKLAVTEACVCMIGSVSGGLESLRVDFQVAPKRWVIEVRGFSQQHDEESRLPIPGTDDLGLVVMQALVDEVILEGFDSSGAVLRLVKNL